MKRNLLELLARNRARGVPGGRPFGDAVVASSGTSVVVYLYDAIVATKVDAEWFGGVSAEELVPLLRGLDASQIDLRINSPGGDVFAAQAIAQALRDSKARVIAHVDGIAASAATIVATAADEIEIAVGALYMVHRGWTIAMGNANDMLEVADLLDKVDGTMAAQYAKRTGGTVDEMLAVMDAETWMTAQEAVDGKFVDRVAQDQESVDGSWDLSAYNRAPARADAPAQSLESEEHRDRRQQRMRVLATPPTVG